MQQVNVMTDHDPLYVDAVKFFREKQGEVNATMLQQEFLIGYNRALRIILAMEDEGIISKVDHVGQRKVL